jgi:prepilin-type N-terminal cleavage/methylation domain-containing protein
MKRTAAFTLIEVLVVCAVIAVVSGMLLPALGQGRARVRALVCLQNLRQWGLATHLYAADHDDYLPPDGAPNPGPGATNVGWYVQLPAQMGLARYQDQAWHTNAAVNPGRCVWICPANPRRSNGRNLFHYCLNEHVNGTGAAAQPIRLGSITAPAVLIWLFDSKNLPAVGGWSFVHTNLHNHGAQFVFLDAHTARFRNTAYWDFAADSPRTDHPQLQWLP